jgi:cholesterol oxidase
MPSLSTPIGELRSEYAVVVIGSGYGGAIAAYRLAEAADNANAPFSVCVLERGLERQAGDFPSSFSDGVREIQADTRLGHIGSRAALFDFRVYRDVSVLVGCGLGGGSLINAGVMLEPNADVLDDFPAAVRGPIRRHFGQVRDVLGVNPAPADLSLHKVNGLTAAAATLNMKVDRAPVAISFTTKRNRFDVQQKQCTLCGSCISGCNHSAKNTVATNYLAGAANAGAAIFCGVETRAIQPGDDEWWLVHVRLNDGATRGHEMIIRARMVFLAAGTLGSTEILLRSRKSYGLTTSKALGNNFSGNGDVIAFGYNTADRVNGFGFGQNLPPDASVGPTIAATIDERRTMNGRGPTIQEGAVPGALRLPLRFGAPVMARVTQLLADGSFDFRFRHLWREVDTVIRGAGHGALARTQTFLVMARDDVDGTMTFARDRLRITWEDAGYREMYDAISKRLQQLTKAMKGRYVINPFWSRLFGRRLMTVHPLGGCRIGDDAAEAVVDCTGQVFNSAEGTDIHRGLYVCDGSVIPTSLGTNPALTISALAEHIAQTASSDPLLLNAPVRAARPGRIDRSVPGLAYGERLRGQMWLDDRRTRVELRLRISAENIDELLTSPDHTTRIVGTMRTGLADDDRTWTITEGTLNVHVDDPLRVDTKLLVYRLKLTNRRHRELWLRGHKTINLQTLRRHPWLAVSRVPFVLYRDKPAEPQQGIALDVCRLVEKSDRSKNATHFIRDARRRGIPLVGVGSGRSSVADAIRLVAGLRVTHEPSVVRRLRLKWRYMWYFLDAIIQSRVWALRRTRAINPFDVPVSVIHRKDNLGTQITDRPRSPRFQLTRYKRRRKKSLGPVVLAPGFGMSTFAFYAAGDDSFAEYLHRRGYEVWFLDYRASDDLAASLEQFDIDELALSDFPAAIDTIYRVSGKRKVRVVAHCLASLTMQMSLLSGKMNTDQLQSVVLSQSFAFIDLPWVTRLKVRLHLPEILSYLNFRPVVTTDYDIRASLPVRLLDRMLYFFPSEERCHEGVCRRLLLFYGEVVRHDQLDVDTHGLFYHLFDRGNLTSFRHIGTMFARGRIVDKKGKNVYLKEEHAPRITVPITLLSGMANRMFFPSGARKTHDWLLKWGGFGPLNREMFTLLRTPNHGHLDSFIGKNAKREVFPKVAEALAQMDRTLVSHSGRVPPRDGDRAFN